MAGGLATARASTASEPRERSAPAKRRARERVGESEGRSPSEKTRSYLIMAGGLATARASTASEPRERSAPAKRRARERAGESEGRSPSDNISRLSLSVVIRISQRGPGWRG